MGIRGNRPTAVAALILAAITFANGVVESHGHDPLDLSAGHVDLPAFSAGHDQPDHAVHIESATHVESAACIGCLQRQRERADGSPKLALRGFEADSSVLAEEATRHLAADARRLPASRAPPRA